MQSIFIVVHIASCRTLTCFNVNHLIVLLYDLAAVEQIVIMITRRASFISLTILLDYTVITYYIIMAYCLDNMV